MENCRLLMRICSNARDILMMHSMRFLKPLLCIYWGESPKSMKLPTDSSSVAQRFCNIPNYTLVVITCLQYNISKKIAFFGNSSTKGKLVI